MAAVMGRFHILAADGARGYLVERHQELGDTPPIFVLLFSPGADQQSVIGLLDLEHRVPVTGLAAAGKARIHGMIVIDLAVQIGDMRRINTALRRLRPIAFLQALGRHPLHGWQARLVKLGRLGNIFFWPHIDPDNAAPGHAGYDLSDTFAAKLVLSGSDGISTQVPSTSNFQP